MLTIKWNPGHKCSQKELSVLIIQQEEEEQSDGEEETPPMRESEPKLQSTEIEVSLNSVVGITGHNCSRKESSVLIIQQEEEEQCDGEEETTLMRESEPKLQSTEVEVCLNSVVDITAPRTMKLRGILSEQDAVLLIDFGASRNFVSEELVEKLQIPPSISLSSLSESTD
ncbi:hypothetical protein OROMI_024072 [Orobanche minor]